jgi:hypothetical protein
VELSVVLARLDATVSARWRRRLIGAGAEEGRHWRTKVAYYEALCRVLSPDTTPSWSEVTDAVEGGGSRSTFYEVTGKHAKHPLLAQFRVAGSTTDGLLLAHLYDRSSAVERLIDEAKAWTFWPYRECLPLLCQLDPGADETALANLLVRCVRDWARRFPVIAGALDAFPPVCAVEDLLALRPGQLSPMSAVTMLIRVTREALEVVPAG